MGVKKVGMGWSRREYRRQEWGGVEGSKEGRNGVE